MLMNCSSGTTYTDTNICCHTITGMQAVTQKVCYCFVGIKLFSTPHTGLLTRSDKNIFVYKRYKRLSEITLFKTKHRRTFKLRAGSFFHNHRPRAQHLYFRIKAVGWLAINESKYFAHSACKSGGAGMEKSLSRGSLIGFPAKEQLRWEAACRRWLPNKLFAL